MRNVAALAGYKAMAYAPMLWNERGIGAIGVSRAIGGFSAKELALLQTFADQAAIAIQNARLFNETKEALERRRRQENFDDNINFTTWNGAAAADGSVADARPVFEKIMDSCKRLIPCDGGAILVVDDQQQVEIGAVHGDSDGMFTRGYPRPIERTVLGLAFDSRRPLYYPEARTAEGVPELARRFATKAGFDSLLIAPMIWEGRRIGSISIARQAAFAFSEKDIDLLQSFADQGVIAIQNARLFKETNEALKRQTASAEILSVISSSVADTAPVFDKILESCRRLFASTAHGILLIDEQGSARIAAHDGPERERVTELVAAGFADGLVQVEALRSRQPLHFVDALSEEARGPVGRVAQRLGIGSYSQVAAPMMWQDRPVGWLYAIRQPATGFSEIEIAQMKTFADQAVIASRTRGSSSRRRRRAPPPRRRTKRRVRSSRR